MTYDPAEPDGTNATLSSPISPNGQPELERTYVIPAREGRAVRLRAGQSLTMINDTGHQVCDFFALVDGAPAEFLSMEHCRTALGRVYVRQGDTLVTNRRRNIIEVIEDTPDAIHDSLIACCDLPRYEQLGVTGYHDNCADNFRMALRAIDVTPVHVPSPFNVWMNIPVHDDGRFTWDPPASAPGDAITLKAHLDCIAVMSACPQDLTPVNGIGTSPSALSFVVT